MSQIPDFYQISLKLILKNKKNEVLLLKVEDGSKYNGYYDFPGGRIDEEEFGLALPEIIKREVQEEIGDEIKYELSSKLPIGYGRHQDFVKRYNRQTKFFYLLFEAELISGNVKISDEHVDHIWMPYDEIKNNLDKLFVSGLLECAKMYFK